MAHQLTREEFIQQSLRMVAPGTPLREGLENVLRAKTGGLIVVGNTEEMMELVDGGFSIDCDFSPSYLYELAKMDGAIILSSNGKRILYANTQLHPDSSIPATETGIRHRTAERVAKQTGLLVISISQRRNLITLYQGEIRYILKDIGVILTKANQAIQTLEKYKSVLDQALINLSAMEYEGLVTLQEVASVIQRIEMVLRIKWEIENYILELGTEGRLISMQLDELVNTVEDEALLLIQDYTKSPLTDPADVLQELKKLNPDELLEPQLICRSLGYTGSINIQEEPVTARGFRIVSRIPRLPHGVVENLIAQFQNFSRILMASIEELDDVEGIGEVRARAIKDGLKRIQEQVFFDRHL